MKGMSFESLYSKYITTFEYSLISIVLDWMLSSSPVISSSSHVITALSSLHAETSRQHRAEEPLIDGRSSAGSSCAPAMIWGRVLPFCSPRAALFHVPHLCCCTLTASHTLPIRELRAPAVNQPGSVMTPAFHRFAARLFVCETLWCYFLHWFPVVNLVWIPVVSSAFCFMFILLVLVHLFLWLWQDFLSCCSIILRFDL